MMFIEDKISLMHGSITSELIGESTVPVFLDDETSAKLVEVDTERDLDDWCRQYKYKGANI